MDQPAVAECGAPVTYLLVCRETNRSPRQAPSRVPTELPLRTGRSWGSKATKLRHHFITDRKSALCSKQYSHAERKTTRRCLYICLRVASR